jgi:hypothetical protein
MQERRGASVSYYQVINTTCSAGMHEQNNLLKQSPSWDANRLQLFKKCSPSMEQEGSLPCSQEPIIGPSRGPDEFSPHFTILFLIRFSIIVLSMYKQDNHRRMINWLKSDSWYFWEYKRSCINAYLHCYMFMAVWLIITGFWIGDWIY